MPRDLLIGCGSRRDRSIKVNGRNTWGDLTTLDNNPAHKPDILWDLNITPWVEFRDYKGYEAYTWPGGPAIPDNSFDEIHAYEVLEHLGQQGDAGRLFKDFGEIYRILKPGGYLAATVPRWDSMWAWGDPSHTRIINEGTLAFLDQEEYHKQVGVTPMSDFRYLWKGDFTLHWFGYEEHNFGFILKAEKPARTFGPK